MAAPSNFPIDSPGINIATVKQDDYGWKFLLVLRAEGESYPGIWGLVTGGREGDETAAQLAVRELEEETGLRPEKLFASEYCVQFYEPTADHIWVLPVLVAVVAADSEVRLSEENSDYQWVTTEEGMQMVVWQNLREVLGRLDLELLEYPAPNWVELPVD
jgi:dATP pyrophosphohydrolase